jgi:hypothetical protein
MSKPTIQFRCWYCNRRHSMPPTKVRERFRCSCDNELRVPRYSGGKCRVKTPVDWIVEAAVYGGGGALLGLGLALLILAGFRGIILRGEVLLLALPACGLLFGVLGGERGVNWIGRMIRGWEEGD